MFSLPNLIIIVVIIDVVFGVIILLWTLHMLVQLHVCHTLHGKY